MTVIGIPDDWTGDRVIKLYPNPFREFLVVEFEIRQIGGVSISIYNSEGKEVAYLLKDNFSREGIHMVTWDARCMVNGLYFCQLRTRNWVYN